MHSTLASSSSSGSSSSNNDSLSSSSDAESGLSLVSDDEFEDDMDENYIANNKAISGKSSNHQTSSHKIKEESNSYSSRTNDLHKSSAKSTFDSEKDVKKLEYEASEALIALATGFSSSDERAAINSTCRQDGLSKSKEVKAKKGHVKFDSDTDSASESERIESELEMHHESVAFDHSYCLPRSSKPSVDSIIDSVVKGEDKRCRGRSRATVNNENKQPKRTIKKGAVSPDISQSVPCVASEWRKAKRTTAVTDSIDEYISDDYVKEEPKVSFRPRNNMEEMNILYDFYRTGIDAEDIAYMKRSYDAMLQEDLKVWWLNDTHWSDHPPTNIPSPRKKRKSDDSARVHASGCARTEGYYKMSTSEKQKHSYLTSTTSIDDANESKQLRARMPTTQQSTREARSNQRRLLASVDAAWSDLLKFNQLQVCY